MCEARRAGAAAVVSPRVCESMSTGGAVVSTCSTICRLRSDNIGHPHGCSERAEPSFEMSLDRRSRDAEQFGGLSMRQAETLDQVNDRPLPAREAAQRADESGLDREPLDVGLDQKSQREANP